MQRYFGVDPAIIHAEIAAKAVDDEIQRKKEVRRKALCNLEGPASQLVTHLLLKQPQPHHSLPAS